jgi:MFS family permease
MLTIVVQLLSAMIVERGASRRRLTIASSLLNVAGWGLIVVMPFVMKGVSKDLRIGILIGIITLNTVFAYVSGNARSSWIGDLIPARQRGAFFGRLIMYAGIIGALLAMIEGTFLDRLKKVGIEGFSWLFLFGMVFGLINILLFLPQADVPLHEHHMGRRFREMVKDTVANRPLMAVMVYAVIWSLQTIAGPFYVTYILRDLKMSFLSFGILGGVSTVTMLLSSPFWGRIVDRYGCRPVLIACTAYLAPTPLVWFWMTKPIYVYAAVLPLNLIGGFAIAGISVALNTLIYKVTPSAGRSVQLAVYSVIVILLAAPMPAIGGHLPDWLSSLGISTDIRCTFYVTCPIMLAAAWAARRIGEPDASHATEMVKNLPGHVRRPATLEADEDA